MPTYLSLGYDPTEVNFISSSKIFLNAQNEANLSQPLAGYSEEIMKYAPNLGTHLTSVNYDAQVYENTVAPSIDQDLANFLNFSNMWISFSGDLVEQGNAGNWDKVKQGLSILQAKAESYQFHTTRTQKSVASLNAQIKEDVGRFNDDYEALLGANGGIVKDLNEVDDLLKSIQKEIDELSNKITSAAIQMGVGVLVTSINTFNTFNKGKKDPKGKGDKQVSSTEDKNDKKDDKPNPTIAVDGLAKVVQGGVDIINMTDQLNAQLEEFTKNLVKKAELSADVTVLGGLRSVVGGMGTAYSRMINGYKSLDQGWDQFVINLKKTIQEIEGQNIDKVIFNTVMSDADTDWRGVKEQVSFAQSLIANQQFEVNPLILNT